MLKMSEKTPPTSSTEKPRKKLSFRDPEVEGGVSSRSKRFFLGLPSESSAFYNDNYVNSNDDLYHRGGAATVGVKQPSQMHPQRPTKIGSPRRQSLIQLQPISTVIRSRNLVNDEPKTDEIEQEMSSNKISNDSSNFEKQLRFLLEKELTSNTRTSPENEPTSHAVAAAPSTAAKKERALVRGQQAVVLNEVPSHAVTVVAPTAATLRAVLRPLGRNQQPEIVVDDVDGYSEDYNDIEDDRMTNGSLDDVFLESQAMRIVRTVGQAFEVCHKLSLHHSQQTVDGLEDAISERSSDVVVNAEKIRKLKSPADGASEPNSCDTQTEEIPPQDANLQQQQQQQLQQLQLVPETSGGNGSASTSVSTPTTVSVVGNLQRPNRLEPIPPPPDSDLCRGAPLTEGETYSSPMSKPLPAFDTLPSAGTPLSTHHQVQLLREQLDQQQQQTQVAIAQVHLLRDQLAAETAARLEVQARIHQLLVHNRELLDHIHRLVLQMQELEAKTQEFENKSSPQRYQQQQQQQEYNYLSQIPITTPSPAPTSFPDYQSIMDPQAINNMAADQSSLYENHNPSISGLEPPTSPLQMCNSPVPSYGSGGVTPLHYTGSLNRSPSLRQQQQHTPPINNNEQLRQVLSNNSNSNLYYQQQQQQQPQRSGSYYRSPPNTAPPAILRQMQQTTNDDLDPRFKAMLPLSQQDNYLDNYSMPMPKLNPPPQRKRPTSRQSSVVTQQQMTGQGDDGLTPGDVNMCNSNEDLLVKQRLQLANSLLMNEQVNKMVENSVVDKSVSDVTQQTLIDLGNLSLSERSKQQQQQQQQMFFQSNGPGGYVVTPPRSAPHMLTTYMDDTNLERLGRMQRMTWTRHTVGK